MYTQLIFKTFAVLLNLNQHISTLSRNKVLLIIHYIIHLIDKMATLNRMLDGWRRK